ncbi:MAG: PHP domain-containing protein [Cellulosilyticaceae bacterium]
MKYSDLHNHTVWSDGDHTIADVIGRAVESGLGQVGISDHFEMIEDIDKYIGEIIVYKNAYRETDIRIGVEIKIQTLLGLAVQEIQYLGSKLDYLLIEDIEYRCKINEMLDVLQSVLNSMACKVGWAHLDLERLGDVRERVLKFTATNKMFLDFNIEADFYKDVLQGFSRIDDVLFEGIEIIVGSDTHAFEDEWIECIKTAQGFVDELGGGRVSVELENNH